MPKMIALAGKGGVGKTTVAALTIRNMIKNKMRPILAMDADPNSNLGETLGVDVDRTIGDMREDFMKHPDSVPSGMDKTNYLEMMMNQLLIENDGFDLLVMGRQEGPGCYCYVNNVLRKFSENLTDNYKYMIADNEAGMEHLSRRTNHKIDHLWLVTDHALRGLRAVRRIKELVGELKLDVKNMGVIVNRAPDELFPAFLKELEDIGVPLLGTIPDDTDLMTFDMERKSLMDMPDDSPAVSALNKILLDCME